MEKSTANVSFYCRYSKRNRDGLAPIELSLIINKKRCYIQLPRKEDPDVFKKAVSSKRGSDIRLYLDSVRTRVNEIETILLREGEPLTANTLKEYFQTGGYQVYTVGNLFDDYLRILKIGITFGNSRLFVIVLKTLEDYKREGDMQHHCVYTNGYYGKPNTLILSARMKDAPDKPVETVEISLKTGKILQCFGACNQYTDYHDEIRKLVSKNSYKFIKS